MKKIIITALFAVIYQAYALFGFGAHIGYDDTNISSQKISVLSINDNEYSYTMTRTEFDKNPLELGAQLYFDLPVLPVGFEFGFEGAWAKYKWTGSADIGDASFVLPHGYEAEDGMYSEEFDFSKIGVDATAKWYMLSFPPVVKTFKFYAGGGGGVYFITPIISDKMIIKELEKQYSSVIPAGSEIEFDVDDYIKKVTVFGYHIVGGIQMKLPAVPISFNVDYKYVMTPENDYGDPTNNFGVIKGSINFYM